MSCTPTIQGVSTSQHMSHSVIRFACDLAVVCGVRLRHMALLFSVLFLLPMTKSSIKRWMDDIGAHLPPPEEMLRHLLALAPATECHIDGSSPLGTDHCVMVVQDEHDRILITHEVVSENGDDARQFPHSIELRGGVVITHRKPPEVRICRLRNQSVVGTRPPSTSTPHCPACLARR